MIDQPEKNSTISNQGPKSRFRQVCASVLRWTFIVLLTAALLAGLYFQAPWKILTLIAVLLTLLTFVPKPYRKYGWATLGVIALAVAIWIFIPENSTGDWKIYEFEDELTALESQRILPPEHDAAPLYTTLYKQWQEIEKNDPFPEEADKEDVSQTRAWSAEEFPQLAAWFKRHDSFFQDLIEATKKPGCFFPAAVSTDELSESMDRLTSFRHLAQHSIRLSYLEIDRSVNGGLEKQIAVLNMGKHFNQQPMLIDMLVGLAMEGVAREALIETLMNTGTLSKLTYENLYNIKANIQASHFERDRKLKQILAYERLFAKNYFGKFYEINSKHKIRFSRFETLLTFFGNVCPDKKLPDTYMAAVRWKASRLFLWLSGLPNDPEVISEWTEQAYRPIENVLEKSLEPDQLDTLHNLRFRLDFEYAVHSTLKVLIPSFKSIGRILIDANTRKKGAEIVCDLALYRKEHGEYPNSIKELRHSDEKANASQYSEFVYDKIDDSFKLYGIGQNGIDEHGQYKIDPNSVFSADSLKIKTGPDDIMIWPN